MEVLKPGDLFRACEQLGYQREPMLTFLPPSDIGSVRSIEAAVIVALLRLSKSSSILEIGTFKGFTTALLSMNSHYDAKVYSIDLPKEDRPTVEFNSEDILADGRVNDLYLIEQQFKDEASYLNFLNARLSEKIKLIKADSTKMDFCEILNFDGKFDFIFIDGGHDFKTAYSDSIKALNSISENSLILWHDFDSNLHSDVSKAISEISSSYKLHSISGTSFAIYLPENLLKLIQESKEYNRIQEN